ncbi:MAG: cytidine deaminase [Anaerolineae bacterium]|nr:cytidine deaminase [Anaerolineae bacterium]
MLTDEQRENLVQSAMEARKWVYAPYSNYPVGAALLTTSGRIYDGVNIENAAYTVGVCAERVAAFKAVSQGEREFAAIAVVTRNGGSPCGACRQVLSEFGMDAVVLIANEEGEVIEESSIRTLLPGAFGPGNLDAGN